MRINIQIKYFLYFERTLLLYPESEWTEQEELEGIGEMTELSTVRVE